MASSNTERRKAKLPADARIERVRALLAGQSFVSIPDLAGRFGVSEMTVRRDLARLEAEDRVRRTHGGAVVAERMVFEFQYGARGRIRRSEKQAIAREARKLVQPGQRVILDAGTTTWELAVLLKDCPNLTVITPSLAVASELQYAPNVEVVLLGGILRSGSPDLTGPLTEHCLRLFSADWAFQGAEGISRKGEVFNIDLQLGQMDQKMRGIAERSCLLADSSKIGRTALYRNGHLRDFHTFVTDGGAPREFLENLDGDTPRVIVAS